MIKKVLRNSLIFCVLCFVLLPLGYAATEQEEKVGETMNAFTSIEAPVSEHISISDERKRLVMFSLGVPLLILILLTGGLGIAMGVYGKPVFLAHMVCAGLSMTLALGHAIVGIVWFYPF